MSASVFVMSDVVGSTALWETHGEAMRTALETHDRLLHGAIESAGGNVFKHTGDGMIAVFDDADNAVTGALEAVNALTEGDWGDTGALTVRVSVHAGTASERDGDFFGPPVNKVARINGIGHGGQVLVSDVARQLMVEPSGLDLGVHQLRDLSEPVRLWQLDDGDHPALRTLKKARHNLPVMPTEFIGRQTEVDELRALVDQHRLVTICGVGGCGKTRLAIEVAAASADKFPGGVWFLDLTTERDGDNVSDRAIGALGLFQQLGTGHAGPVDVLNDATTGAATLLIVDNCEHLIDDVADFASEVLTSAGSVTILATSREALSVDGEWAWRIPNMHDTAVELFLARAAAAGVAGLEDHLDRIEEICVQLDDIPLAIELAAARVSSLSINELAERLDDRFSLLGGGRGRRRQRQQTLQAMMDWSYGLLTSDEQTVLDQLAVFAGTFPLSGVETVATATATPVLDVLGALVEQSLVVPSVDTGRYRLLETVRLYALDRLINTDQLGDARDRHLSWMVGLSGRERLYSTGAGETWDLEEQKQAETVNAIAAMEWAEQTGQHDALLSLYLGGITYWNHQMLPWIDRVPEPPATEPNLRVDWLQTSGRIVWGAGDYAKGMQRMKTAAAMFDGLTATLSVYPTALMYRAGNYALEGDRLSAIADPDRALEMQIEGDARYPEWVAAHARVLVQMIEHPEDFLADAMESAEIGEEVSRNTHDIAMSSVATALALDGRFGEALTASMACLDSPVLLRSIRIGALVPAVGSLAGLARIEDALQVVQKDFGPIIEAQRQALTIYRLTALALILHQLGLAERFQQVAALALTHQGLTDRGTISIYLANLVDSDDPATDTATQDIRTGHLEALVDDVITEIRDHITNDEAVNA
jgi:predicted ATPase/class 3 adenylate cyclase